MSTSSAAERTGRLKAAGEEGLRELLLGPNPADPRLTERVRGLDERGAAVETNVVVERPLTLFLNGQEIVTMMTIGDYPEYLAVGFLLNQNMLLADDVITGIDYEEDVETVVVRTERQTDYEEKLKKKIRTSGCAQGTVFGDVMEKFEHTTLPADTVLKTSWIYALSKRINTTPSLYLEAGAIHGCVLCENARPLVYMEDVGRHNAVDKIAGYMLLNNIPADDKSFYTTGRLTSEMVIKVALMGIPVLLSRSGITRMGLEIAQKVGVTLIARAKGRHFLVYHGREYIEFDAVPAARVAR